MIASTSQIVITANFQELEELIEDNFNDAKVFSFIKDEFKIEDAKEVVAKAYIASKELKVLLLAAKRFNIYAQNALLKILEEPPSKTIFIVAAPAKSIFLPTILSRLPVIDMQQQERRSEKYFEKFDLQTLFDLATTYKRASKDEAKEIIKQMLLYAMEQDYKLSQKELDYFGKAVELIELNSAPANVIITAGLLLLQHRKRVNEDKAIK